MARVTSELIEIASISLQIAKAEIMATGDPETLLWALDQFREADACLRAIMAEQDIPSEKAETETEAA